MHYDALSLSDFIALSPIAIAHIDEQSHVLESNEAFRQLTRDRFVEGGPNLKACMDDEDRSQFSALLVKLKRDVPAEPTYLKLTLDDAEPVVAFTYANRLQIDGQAVIILHMVDQTEQKNLEMRFAHSQKMQAVGQLAGGVAHDFNNLLTAMIGFCDLLLMRHPAGDPSFADIMQVKQNANRAANLVRQLLAFSRRQTLQPKMLDMTDVLAELSNLIRRLIGENIDLNMLHGRDLGQVKADQGQLEQVIINLAVNARDAMPEGGSLRIESSRVQIAQAGLPKPHMIAPAEDDIITPGEYILVEIEDSGTGIPREIVTQIFEPFFSTKEIGSGTGLGLATVYGIIKQTGGYVYVTTREGKGTTFSLYFKRYAEAEAQDAEAQEEAKLADLSGGETILLVEDEAPVRMFAVRALRNKGYEVLEADCGEHALEVFEGHAGTIDLIVTDVMMPGINGPTMIETLQERFCDRMAKLNVIFISGYAEDAFTGSFGEGREFHFLAKPFTLKQLAAKVKEVISG
jgi:two-component system cell cycle sensor histidine kinase/response regulator CckA